MGLGVMVGIGVKVGVKVDVKVGVMVGVAVNVGPKTLLELQAVMMRLIKTKIMVKVIFLIISPHSLISKEDRAQRALNRIKR